MKNGITVLIPGGFKPCTGAHLSLIERYAEEPEVNEVRVLVGPGIRDGIDQKKATEILKRLTSKTDKVSIEAVTWPSPVLTAYKIIEKAEPGYYSLGASSKGDDYKRVEDFVQKHSGGGKYSREDEGVFVVELPVDSDPLLFRGRNDEYEGTPISASVLRKDIMNDDLDNFVTGYPNSDPEDIEWVWDQLASNVMNESYGRSLVSDGPSTDSTTSNYDRSQPGYFYRSTFPIMEDGEEEIDDISEGGGAGHLISPWEDLDTKFGEIRDIISKALSGKLENVTEKLDGSNLMITVKDGEVFLARSKKEMRNRGELAKRWDIAYEDIKEDTPENIRRMLQSFRDALKDLQRGIELFKNNPNSLFGNGSLWLNIELLNPSAENIIPYMETQLRIHNLKEVDGDGNEIDLILSGGNLAKIIEEFDRIQESGELQSLHQIKMTNRPVIDPSKKLEKIQKDLESELDTLMGEYHLDDSNTLKDFIAEEFKILVDRITTDPDLSQKLINRFGYGIKSPNIGQIVKGLDPETTKMIKSIDNDIEGITGKFLDPIIKIFSKLGIAVLRNLKGLAATNPEAVTEKMVKKTSDAINKIGSYIKKGGSAEFEKKVKYLETQLRRLEQGGGLQSITPSEGIVFDYNGRLLKLTGVYLPILKMINFFQFGKDKDDDKKVYEFHKSGNPSKGLGLGKYEIYDRLKKSISNIKWAFPKDKMENLDLDTFNGGELIKIIYYGLMSSETDEIDVIEYIINNYWEKIKIYVNNYKKNSDSRNVNHSLFQNFWMKLASHLIGFGDRVNDQTLNIVIGNLPNDPNELGNSLTQSDQSMILAYLIRKFIKAESLNEFHKSGNIKKDLDIGMISELRRLGEKFGRDWETNTWDLFKLLQYLVTYSEKFREIAIYLLETPEYMGKMENPDMSDIWMLDAALGTILNNLIVFNYDEKHIKWFIKLLMKIGIRLDDLPSSTKSELLFYILPKYINT